MASLLATAAALALALSAQAAVTVHDSFASWSAEAEPFTTITFGEIPLFSTVTDQYASLGVLFTDIAPNKTDGFDTIVFPEDGYGLKGYPIIELTLLSPATGIAAHFPGGIRFRLFSGDVMIFESPYLGGSGYGFFGGVVSDLSFDRVQIVDQISSTPDPAMAVDNLYISFAPVPAPGAAVALLGVALLGGRRRRAER
jgi:MYXO-CTERM domain-containing protein